MKERLSENGGSQCRADFIFDEPKSKQKKSVVNKQYLGLHNHLVVHE